MFTLANEDQLEAMQGALIDEGRCPNWAGPEANVVPEDAGRHSSECVMVSVHLSRFIVGSIIYRGPYMNTATNWNSHTDWAGTSKENRNGQTGVPSTLRRISKLDMPYASEVVFDLFLRLLVQDAEEGGPGPA